MGVNEDRDKVADSRTQVAIGSKTNSRLILG
jgi:hypothetical protein